METSQSPGLPGTSATTYNPEMCLLALPVILNKDIISDIRVSFLFVNGGASMVVKTIFEY
jgi:hypothetical protein